MTSSSQPAIDPTPLPRVDIAERRLHPAYLLISLGRTVRSLIPLIAVGIWKAPGWSIGLLAALVALHSVAQWWTRRYSVVDGTLRVRSGLFQKSQDTIGVHRITGLVPTGGGGKGRSGAGGGKSRPPA